MDPRRASSSSPPSPSPLPRKPMARVIEVSLLQREVRERLSRAGLELLLSVAGRLSEGHLAEDGRYFGSTMLTVEMAALVHRARGASDPDLPRRLAEQLALDPEAVSRLKAIAREEAARLSGGELGGELEVDVGVRAEEGRLCIDLDVEAANAPPAARGAAGAGWGEHP
jgi:hypothetical protein